MQFHKSLSKYYKKWASDAQESYEYCMANNRLALAVRYKKSAIEYEAILKNYAEEIEFFSQGNNALLPDRKLPERFKGYK